MTDKLRFLADGGKMGALIRAHDWAATPLGLPQVWPQPLRTLVGVLLGSSQPMFLAWGPERTLIYNDAYAEILAAKHPKALGRDFLEVWHEIRADLVPIVDLAYGGEPVHMDDIMLVMERKGYPEETHFSFSYTPVLGEDGRVAGFFCPCMEITEQVLARRREGFRLALTEALRDAGDPVAIMDAACALLGRHLGVAQVGFAEVEDDQAHIVVHRDWNDGRIPSVVGRWRMDDFGPAFIRDMKAGQTIVIPDVGLDPRTNAPEVLANYAGINTRAILDLGLIRDGRMLAMLFTHHPEPRPWAPDEVALVEEAVERLWSAVERARADRRLRDSERRFRAVFENAAIGVARVAFEDAKFLEVNDALCAITGYPREELVARSWVEITHPDDVDIDLVPFRRMAAGEIDTYVVEKRYIRKDGSPVWARLTLSLVRDAEGRPDFEICVVEDIEARRSGEHYRDFLLVLEDRLKPLGDPEQIKLVAAETLGRELVAGRVTYAEVDDDTGVIRVARSFTDRGMPDAAGEYRLADLGALVDLYRTGETFVSADLWVDARVRQAAERPEVEANGGRGILDVPLMKEGRLVALLSINDPEPRAWTADEVRLVEAVAQRTWSAVERAQAQAALRASEARARAQADEIAVIYAAAPVGLTVLDTELRYVRINDRLAEINGLPAAEHIGRTVREVVPDLDDKAVETLQRVLGGEAVMGVEFTGTTPAQPGVVRTWRENWMPLRDTSGGIVGITISAEEVTEERAAEAALRLSEERFRAVQDTSIDGFMVFDAVRDGSGRIVDFVWRHANDASLRIAGRPAANLVGRHLLQEMPGNRKTGLFDGYVRVVETGEPWTHELDYAHDGVDLYVRLVAAKVGDGFAVSFADLSERRRAERRLALLLSLSDRLVGASQPSAIAAEVLGRALEVSRAGHAIADEAGATLVVEHEWTDGTVKEAMGRHRLAEFGGWLAGELRAGRTVVIEDAVTDPRIAGGSAPFLAIAARAVVSVPLLRDGRLVGTLYADHRDPRRWSDDEVRLVEEVAARAWASIERERAEAALAASEQRLRAAIEASESGIFQWDLGTNALTWDGALDRLFGLEPGDTVRSLDAFLAMVHPEDRARVVAACEASASRGVQFEEEFRIVRPSGEVRWLYDRGKTTPGADGRPAAMVGACVDVTTRRVAEAALRESELRFRTLTDATPALVFQSDATGNIFVNARYAEYTGKPVEELLGLAWTSVVHPDDLPRVQAEATAALASGAMAAYDLRLRRADGVWRWHTLRWLPVSGLSDLRIGVALDVEEERQARTTAQAAEARLRAVVEAAPVGLVFADTKGAILEGNARVEEIVGHPVLPSPDVDRYRDWEGYHPDGRRVEGREYPLARVLTGDVDRDELEVLYRRGDGRDAWIRFIAAPLRAADGTLLGGVVASLDIDRERRLTDALAREVEAAVAQRQQLWAVSNDLFVVADFEGRMLEVSDSWTRVLGWSRETLLRKPYHELIHPEDLAATLGRLTDLRSTGQTITYENRAPTQDGEWRRIAWSLSAAPGSDRLYGVGRDVTDERAAAEQLAQLQKLETIGQLTGGVAHDFNNLLTPIVATLDIVRRRTEDDERAQRLLAGALQSAERARTLIQRLLAFARRQTLQPQAVDPGGLIEGMRELIDRSLGPTITVRLDVAPDLPAALVDPNQLELALLNLAVNARDAMPRGGALTIAAAREDVAEGPMAQELPPGAYVRLSVCDAGIGMDAETLKRAVEPFFSTKGVGQGTGLGLSMVHGLAAQSGGAFQLASEPGRGTTATLWLPAAEAAAEVVALVEAEVPRAPRPACVLLVDDEELVRSTTADSLRELGYEIVEAGSAAAALERVRAGLKPDLVLTDHMMPGMSGAELAAELRGRVPALPVLMITGYSNLSAEQTRDLAVIAKPFRLVELAAAMSSLLSGDEKVVRLTTRRPRPST